MAESKDERRRKLEEQIENDQQFPLGITVIPKLVPKEPRTEFCQSCGRPLL